MKKSKRILSLLTALTIAASSFAAMVIPASAAAGTYIDENFNSYTTGQIIASVGSATPAAPADVTKGSLIFSAGRRNNATAINNSASIAEVTTGDNELKVSADGYSGSGRGVKFAFASDANIPAVSSLADGEVLELSMKIKATGPVEITGYGTIPAADLTTTTDYVNLRVVLDKTSNKQYHIVTDTTGAYLNSVVSDLSATTFAGVSFQTGNSGAYNIDDLKVQSKNKDAGVITLSLTDGTNPIDGATAVIAGVTRETPATGIVYAALPYSSTAYDYSVTKAGYEATAGQQDPYVGNITVSGDQTINAVITRQTYTAVPETVTITGGQGIMTAPHSAASVNSSEFGVTVIDQRGVAIDDADVVWTIVKTDGGQADANVTVADGVITVKKEFNGGEKGVTNFTVTATATKNGTSKSATATIDIASGYFFYEPGIGGSSYGTTNAAPAGGTETYIANPEARDSKNTITLPDPIVFTPGTAEVVNFKTTVNHDTGFTFQRMIEFVSSDDVASAKLAYINLSIGDPDRATWSNGGNGSSFNDGAVYYTLSAINTWVDVAILYKTNAQGVTSVKLTLGTGDDAVSYDLGRTEATDLAKLVLSCSKSASASRYALFKDITIEDVDVTGMAISGPDKFTSVTGATVEKEYEIDAMVIQDDETFAWSTDKSADGVTITPSADTLSATLSVPGTFTGTIKVSAVSSTSTQAAPKKADKEVTIAAATAESAEIVGTKTVHYVKGATESYTLTNVKDQNGDDITEYVNPTWSLKDRTPVTLPKATLTVDASAVGDAVAIFPVYEGTALKSVTTAPVKITGTSVDIEGKTGQKVLLWNSLDGIKPLAEAGTITGDDVDNVNYITNTGVLNLNVKQDETVVATVLGTPIEQPVKIGTYYLELTSVNITEGKVDISDLVTDDKISGYQVSTKTGETVTTTVVPKTEVTENKIAITGTPNEIEIAPVYALSEIPDATVRGKFALPADTYNFTITLKSGTNRTDVYANGQLLVNNMFQYGSTPDTETVHDICVEGGEIEITTDDYGDGKSAANVTMTAFTAVKTPTLKARVPKIYVLGDSLVCKYYNGDKTKDASADDKLKQTGWGQVLQNYIKDDYEVVDIANSGVTAMGLAGSAITQVIESGKPGDILLLESGYNDKKENKEAGMKQAIRDMVAGARAAGVDVILVSPNASMHDFTDSVQWTGKMEDMVKELNTKYIDLSQLSNDFLAARYDKATFCKDGDPSTPDSIEVNEMSKIWNVSDRLHSTLNAAYKWASVVATELGNLGYSDIINTEFIYTFDDVLTLNDLAVGTTGTVNCQATVTTAD